MEKDSPHPPKKKPSQFSNQKIAFQKLKPKPCSTLLYLNRAVSATQGHLGGKCNDSFTTLILQRTGSAWLL